MSILVIKFIVYVYSDSLKQTTIITIIITFNKRRLVCAKA